MTMYDSLGNSTLVLFAKVFLPQHVFLQTSKGKESKEEGKTAPEESKDPANNVAKSARRAVRIGKKLQPKLEKISDCLFWRVRVIWLFEMSGKKPPYSRALLLVCQIFLYRSSTL